MEISFYTIFVFLVVVSTAVHVHRRKATLFCISNITLSIFTIIFVISPLVIPGNSITTNVNLLVPLLVGFYIMVLIFNSRHPIRQNHKEINFAKFGYSNALNIVFFIIVLRVLYLFAIGEYSNFLTRDRSADRLETYYEDSFNAWGILRTMMINAFLIVAALCGRFKIGTRKIIIGFILLAIEAAAISEHRTPVITPLILMVVFIHMYIKKLKLVTFVVLAFVVILFMSFSAYIRVGDISLAAGKNVQQRVAHGLRGLNTSESFAEMYDEIERGNIRFEYGHQLFLSGIMPIPRVVWSEKPNVSFSSRMTEKMYGRIGEGNWVRTFTVWGEGYAQFGAFGIILYSILLAYGLKKFIYFLSGFRGMEILLINFMVTLPSLIRTDLFSLYARMVFLLVSLCIAILLLGYIKRKGEISEYKTLIR